VAKQKNTLINCTDTKKVYTKQREADCHTRQERAASRKRSPTPRTRRTATRLRAGEVKRAKFYKPRDFDPSEFGFEPHEEYAVYYFLNLVRWKRIHWQSDAEGFSRLKYDYLERVVGRGLLKRLRWRLHNHGVIDWSHDSEEGKQCCGYRIRRRYSKCRWELVVCEDEALNRRIQRVYGEGSVVPFEVQKWLASKLDLIEFDMPRARSIVSKLPYDPDDLGHDGLCRKLYRPKTAKEYHRILRDQCREIADHIDTWSVCRFGRFHTAVTRLSRALRCCVSVGGQRLVELDVANSQPLFLGIVAREYYRSRMARKRLLGRTFDRPEDVYRYGRRTEENCQPCNNEGVEEYIRGCEEGTFYESLMDDTGDKAERDRVKKAVFTEVFFGPNKTKRPRPLKQRFTKRHPAVAKVLRELKRKDYRQSAWVLQNAEATLVIERICGRIMRERPDTVLFTIHDSLLVLPKDAKYVKSVVEDEFGKSGVKALVRQK
jgi:hypothetical protein